jgi:hypothetical protein
MEAAEEPKPENPLGMASAIVSSLGLMVCLLAVTWGYGLHAKRVAASEKIAAGEYEGGDLTVVTDTMDVGFSFLGQIVVYVVGGLVGGTLSLVGLILAFAGIDRQPNRSAKIGLAASLLGPLVLVAYLLLL